MNGLVKPGCFSDYQWKVYKQELVERKGQKILDICFDCTAQYQNQMRKENKCQFPSKRLGKVTEFV